MTSCKPKLPVAGSDSPSPPHPGTRFVVPSDLNYDRTCRNPSKNTFCTPDFAIQARISPKRIFIARERISLRTTTRRGPFIVRVRCVARLHRIMATIAQCRRYASIFTRVLPCRIGRRVLLVQVMPDWLSVARPSVFLRRCRLTMPLSLSLSSSAFREEATLPARPQEHMFTNNELRGTLLKNQQTERIAPPRFDRQTDRHSSWFNIELLSYRVSTRFLFSFWRNEKSRVAGSLFVVLEWEIG